MATDEEQRKEDYNLQEPAHHARRPMNAFLIFCKRHRGSVRSNFPHLENRAVTRVLGEWWATLTPDQKQSYTNLAQEYKDAFLTANPDFKWYKLPAPPLRTLNTRPTNKKSEIHASESSVSIKTENDNSLNYTGNKDNDQGIQPGKLADESQIGGLSSLFTPIKIENMKIEEEETGSSSSNVNKTNTSMVPNTPKKKCTEFLLTTQNKEECKADLFGTKKRKRNESNNNNNENNELNGEYKEDDDETGSEKTYSRSERTCKGLRYQKFLAEQKTAGSTLYIKQKKNVGSQSTDEKSHHRRNSISSNISEKTDSASSEGGNSSRGELEYLVQSAEGNVEPSKPEETETEGAETELDYGPWTTRKRFRAEDFNLEKKIKALPSLSLEEFQERKKQQRTKKKKIQQKSRTNSGNKKYQGDSKVSDQVNDSNVNNEEIEKTLVGSQKRKARKRSITRNATTVSNLKSVSDQEKNESWSAPTPDLDALACLAAVAAVRTKLTKNT